MPQASWFRWAFDDPHEIEEWANLRLVRSRPLMDAGDELMQHAPWSMKFITRWALWLIRSKGAGYLLNQFLVESEKNTP